MSIGGDTTMKAHQRTVGKNDTWLTPPEIWTKLGHFDTDPACPEFMCQPIATCCYSPSDDGLRQKWTGRVWLNAGDVPRAPTT